MSLLRLIMSNSGGSTETFLRRTISLNESGNQYLAFPQAFTTPLGDSIFCFNIGLNHVSRFGLRLKVSSKNFTDSVIQSQTVLTDPDYSFSDKTMIPLENGDIMCCAIMYGVSDDSTAAQYGHAPGEVYLTVHETRVYVAPANDPTYTFVQQANMPDISLTSGKLFPYGTPVIMPDGNRHVTGYSNVGNAVMSTTDGYPPFTVISEPCQAFPIPTSVGETASVFVSGTTNSDSIIVSSSRMNGAPNAMAISFDGNQTWYYCGSLPDSTTGDRSPDAFTDDDYVYFWVINRNDTQNTGRIFQYDKAAIIACDPGNASTLAADAFVKSWVKYESTCNTKAILSGIDSGHEASTDGSFANTASTLTANGQRLLGLNDLDGSQVWPYGGYNDVKVKGKIIPMYTPLCWSINGILPKTLSADPSSMNYTANYFEPIHSLASPVDTNGIAFPTVDDIAQKVFRYKIPDAYNGSFALGYQITHSGAYTPQVHITIEKSSKNDPTNFTVLDTHTFFSTSGVEDVENVNIKQTLAGGDIVRFRIKNDGDPDQGGLLGDFIMGGNDQLVGGQGYINHFHVIQLTEGSTDLPYVDTITAGFDALTIDTSVSGNAAAGEFVQMGLNPDLIIVNGNDTVDGNQLVIGEDGDDMREFLIHAHVSSITSSLKKYSSAYIRIQDPVDPISEHGRAKKFLRVNMKPDTTGFKFTGTAYYPVKEGERIDVVFMSSQPDSEMIIDAATGVTDGIASSSISMRRIPYRY